MCALIINATEEHVEAFSSEAVTWRQLSHPNVLPFYGVHHKHGDRPRFGLVCPWMHNGNLVQFLSNYPDTDRVPLVSNTIACLKHI